METNEISRTMKACNNGFLHLFLNLALLAAIIVGTVLLSSVSEDAAGIFCTIGVCLWSLHLVGFVVIQPNQCRVFTFFGKYRGTTTSNGFFWVNPFYGKRKLSLRARNMDVAPIKVNDKNGNPIMIGLVLVWKIKDTYKACFDIEVDTTATVQKDGTKTTSLKGYDSFVNVQSDAALRKVAGMYAYDNDGDDSHEVTLRSGSEEVNDVLLRKLNERLEMAGLEVTEARINYLAYAPEIAAVMLRRQQAAAIITAREKIVEGAVSMVKMALDKLSDEEIVELDDEKKAALVGNLLVVLCGDEPAQPVINSGTLNH